MNEHKTNTDPLETPSNDTLLAGNATETDFFAKQKKQADQFINDPVGFMAESQGLLDAGKFIEAFGKYEIAEMLIDREESKKVAIITYKMAETLQRWADSGIEDNETSQKKLKESEVWLNISDQYNETAHEKEKEYKQKGVSYFEKAKKLHKLADKGDEDIKTIRLPWLDEAEKLLNTSDENYAKAHALKSNEFAPAPTTKKRGFRLGIRAVMGTVKSTIRSTLNRHS